MLSELLKLKGGQMRHVFSHMSQQSLLRWALVSWKLLCERNPVSILGKEDSSMPDWHDN